MPLNMACHDHCHSGNLQTESVEKVRNPITILWENCSVDLPMPLALATWAQDGPRMSELISPTGWWMRSKIRPIVLEITHNIIYVLHTQYHIT